MADDVDAVQALTLAAAAENLSHDLRTPLTSLTTYLSLANLRLNRARGCRVGPDDAADAIAELTGPALAAALDMQAAIDRVLIRRAAPSLTLPPASSINPTEVVGMGDRRFDRQWVSWDARLVAGEQQVEILASLRERDLAELLAADAGARRSMERNIIAVALTNKLGKRGRAFPDDLVNATARKLVAAGRTSALTRQLLTDAACARQANASRRANGRVPPPPPEGAGK